MLSEEHLSRVGGIAAILGAILLVVATLFHPMVAHPHDTPAAFAEYALDRYWVAAHLGQFLGAVLISVGFVALSWRLRAGRAGVWALLGGLMAVAGISLAAALQAVDGIALKFMVDRLSLTSAETRIVVFEAAFSVRQIEIGLASLLQLLLGLTVVLFGIALLLSSAAGVWLGGFGIVGGAALLASSIVQAHAGFTDFAMATTMPSTLLVLLWSVSIGVFLLRSPGSGNNAV